jgi:hypothetical protein
MVKDKEIDVMGSYELLESYNYNFFDELMIDLIEQGFVGIHKYFSVFTTLVEFIEQLENEIWYDFIVSIYILRR